MEELQIYWVEDRPDKENARHDGHFDTCFHTHLRERACVWDRVTSHLPFMTPSRFLVLPNCPPFPPSLPPSKDHRGVHRRTLCFCLIFSDSLPPSLLSFVAFSLYLFFSLSPFLAHGGRVRAMRRGGGFHGNHPVNHPALASLLQPQLDPTLWHRRSIRKRAYSYDRFDSFPPA